MQQILGMFLAGNGRFTLYQVGVVVEKGGFNEPPNPPPPIRACQGKGQAYN